MPTIQESVENGARQPLTFNQEIARQTTRSLVGKLEAVALGVQSLILSMAAINDSMTSLGRSVLLILIMIHIAAGLVSLKTGGPFSIGGPFVAAWVGLAIIMPILAASLVRPGDYGADPTCVQLCSYPAAPLVLFAFFPWLGVNWGFLRPAADILLLAIVTLTPLFLIWYTSGFFTTTNGVSVANAAVINLLAYSVGWAIGMMCRTAAQEQLNALRAEYHRLFHYLHGQTENALIAISWAYARNDKELVRARLQELAETLERERLDLSLVDDAIPLSRIFNLHARLLPQEDMLISLPRAGGITIPQSAAVLTSDALGDLVKNIVRHSAAKTVAIRYTLAEGVLGVTVEDDGIGFEADVTLADPTSSLYSLRRLLQRAGGDLRLRSRPGSGTTAQILLPIRTTAGA